MEGHGGEQLNSLRIAVLSGGDSAERDISLQSGSAVEDALRACGHHVTHVDPSETDLKILDWRDYDVAFLALHGAFGEDGAVQSLLEAVGIPYTGSNAETSRLAFSKSASKERFAHCNVSTPPYVLIHESDDAIRINRQAETIGFPLVVKPDAQGSSLGVTLVDTPDELPRALTRGFHFDSFCILERAIIGSEWTVGLLDEDLLPLIQIETDRKFFDYQAKYEDHSTQYHFEFALPTHVVKAIENTARAACDALRTSGLVRVDLMLDKLHQPWVLEINTIPGLTGHSLVPKAAARL
ncbi:MAG: D-alanine--D-alanine ligase [Planctomycetes bacterium]|nr:D-alanine--D-alanine ligase [Planctomycetota bacterium]